MPYSALFTQIGAIVLIMTALLELVSCDGIKVTQLEMRFPRRVN